MAQPTTATPGGAGTSGAPPPETASVIAAAGADEAVDPAKPAGSAATIEGDKPAEKPAGEKPADAPPAAIELKLPEGVALDNAIVDGFKKTAAEVGLDSAKAQKVLDGFLTAQQAVVAEQNKSMQAQDAKWAAELKADPEIGGEKYAASLVDVRRALRHFGGGKVASLIAAAGLGNHPDMVRGFAKMGRALAEDSIAGTSAKAGAERAAPPFESFYDHPTSKQSK
jgi:hypothetical protein